MGHSRFVPARTSSPQTTPTLDSFHLKENYLLKYRLRWGQPDRLSVLKPYEGSIYETSVLGDPDLLPIPTVDYFRADTPPHLISIIVNDWPYSGTSGCFTRGIPTDFPHSSA